MSRLASPPPVPVLRVTDGFGRPLADQYYKAGSSLEVVCQVRGQCFKGQGVRGQGVRGQGVRELGVLGQWGQGILGQGGKREGDRGSESHEDRVQGGRGADKNKDTRVSGGQGFRGKLSLEGRETGKKGIRDTSWH